MSAALSVRGHDAAPIRRERGEPSLTAYAGVTLVLLVAALVVYREHPLVQLGSDPPDASRALFPVGQLLPGESTAATVTLLNRGLIPFSYSVSPTDTAGRPITSDFRLAIRRDSAQTPLYSGALAGRIGPLGELTPGQSVRLGLRLELPAGSLRSRTTLDMLLIWRAQGSLGGAWSLPVAELGLAGADLLLLAAAMREVQRRRRAKSSRAAGPA